MTDTTVDELQQQSVTEMERPTVAIVISGPSRTGKTTAANILAERYEIPNIKIGEKFRDLTGIDTSKFVKRDAKIDRDMDQLQADLIRQATAQAPFILEGRLAAFLASQERERADPPVVTILFWAPEKVRMERQLRKARRDDPQAQVTLTQLRDGEREREARDMALWEEVHPELREVPLFDPNLTDRRGKPVYDLVVDTRIGTPHRCADFVHDWLAGRRAIAFVEKSDSGRS